jgi:hypothetical protein
MSLAHCTALIDRLPKMRFDAHDETDQLQFTGYGPGATFTQNDATHWQINYNGGASHEIITIANAATIHPNDYLFV